LQAISPLDEETLQRGLSQLVDAELIHQRGMLPHRQYIFKHALIQDAAYQSLLKSRRQQLHQQIAQVLEERFAQIKETQPELVAYHYTEASLIKQALPYWQQAGERATQRSAYVEAINHLTRELELLKLLPDTLARNQQELTLQIALGVPLMATKGFSAPEAGAVYRRARELCQLVGETPQLFPVLWGLWAVYASQAELQTAHELGEQCLRLARNVQDPALLVEAHLTLDVTLAHLGEGTRAREHFEQVITLYDPQQHRSLAFLYGGIDPEVLGRGYAAAWFLWFLGYPDQALTQSHEALTLAQGLDHPFSLVWALLCSSWVHQLRREGQLAHERAEAVIPLASEQGFAFELALGIHGRG
jgi:tetratricopeptide (TPR) repeat protein